MNEPMPTVYIDLLFLTNAWIDGLLLSLTATFRHLPLRAGRLIFGALLGAAVGLSVLLPCGTLLQAVFSLFGAFAMVGAAFRPKRKREWLRSTAALYTMLFLYAGTLYAVWLLFFPGSIIRVNGLCVARLSPVQLVLFSAVSYGFLRLLRRFFRKESTASALLPVTVTVCGQTVTVQGLVDTGHTLTEPLSGKPVVIIEKSALPAMSLPSESPETADARCFCKWQIRMVPYHAVGKDGVLTAFHAEALQIGGIEKEAFVALGTEELSAGYYRALIPSDLASDMRK